MTTAKELSEAIDRAIAVVNASALESRQMAWSLRMRRELDERRAARSGWSLDIDDDELDDFTAPVVQLADRRK